MKPTTARVSALATAGLIGLLAGCSAPSSTPSPDTPTAAPSSASPDKPTLTPRPSSPSRKASPKAVNSPGPPVSLRPEQLVSGLVSPWGLVALTRNRTLISERDTKKIVLVTGGDRRTVATISGADPGGEGGLLGLAATEDEKTVFAYYTAKKDNRIVSMTWDGDTLSKPRPILTGIPRGIRHNGGRMVLGPDGDLYIGTGETGDTSLAQDKQSLGGKILRITTDGTPVADNPFGNEVFSYGHRNVEGLAFDDQGRLWASEFGEQTWDELNLITKAGNYGWPKVEGSGSVAGMLNPKVVWKTSKASPAGLAFWRGSLWMAALRGQRLWQIPLEGKRAGDPTAHLVEKYGRLRSVAVTTDGTGLLLTNSNTDGRGETTSGDDRLLIVPE